MFLRVCVISLFLLVLFWFLNGFLIEYFKGAAKLKPSESIKKYKSPTTLKSKADIKKLSADVKSGKIVVKSSATIKKELTDLVKKQKKN
jgi:hypothetical protein